MSINVILMTCLEPWTVDAIRSINEQDLLPDQRHLLVDEFFMKDEGLAALEEMQKFLQGWEIHTHPVNNDFANHKNWMLNKLPKEGEWVLWLDADEVINSKFVSTATSMIEYSDAYSKNKIDAYALAFIHSFEGRDGEFALDWLNPGTWLYPDWHVRFFKNYQHTCFVRMVHEQLLGWKTLVPTSDPKMTILHRKTVDMQHISNKRWRRLDALCREKDPSYLSHLQGEDWQKFINEFED